MGSLCSRLCGGHGSNGRRPLIGDAAPITASDLLAVEKCFYMNFKILNIAEIFPKIMRAKVRQEGKSDTAVTLAGKGGKLLASRSSFSKKFSNKIADKLTDTMPPKLEETGIHFKLTKVHCGEMGFVVLRAEVVDIDLLKLLEKAKGTEFAAKVAPLIGVARRFRDVDRAVLPKVQHQMMLKMEKDIPAMMWEKLRFKMLMICKQSAEQADFFFDALTPHKFEVVFKVLNRQEAAPRLAKERTKQYFGDKVGRGKHLGKVAGAVASKLVARAPDEVFGKLIARRLSFVLPDFLACVGVAMVVTDGFVAPDQSGRTILHCDIVDVDLPALRERAGSADKALYESMAPDQMMLRLGRDGRAKVYEAVRRYIRLQFPAYLSRTKGVQVNVIVKDIEPDPTEMMDIDLSDSEDDDDE
eukprot:TRINITY_DN27031_c0_g1_i1.p1 TRINITY_DN27031_c0_g1~~TRINITY_DN27031_c0_g1_i1.p1  ORF type:complete len:413 (+),score=78.47 TRINITY_DN27031_c0_g1_i1:55-1293(+)